MRIVGLVFGIIAFLGMFIALFPCLGALNWIVVPFAVVGVLINTVSLSHSYPGQVKVTAIVGLILSCIAVFFGFIRLIAGCGIF
jgi:hypothetical protein